MQVATIGLDLAKHRAADHRHPWLLRSRHERPRGGRAAQQRDELAAPHGGTWVPRQTHADSTWLVSSDAGERYKLLDVVAVEGVGAEE
jgi:hypothetical protein